jgi:plasmid stabilization system protein ParE
MKLVITEPAKLHLKDLHDYYKLKASKRVADKIKSGIIEKVKFLKDHPYAGQREDLLGHLNLDHRRFVKGNYKIIYRISDDTIYVTDIFDVRQSPDKMIG